MTESLILGLVALLAPKNRVFTATHDAKVPFGMDVPYGQSQKFIQRHKLYLNF
jgi:hypothetical protein